MMPAQFETAVDAVVAGDIETLRSLLDLNPELARERSARKHRATLLHYVGANGVEDYRQKSPKNAVEIAKILLEAGAEVDAVAEMYGKDTTLGLVATSVHPLRAGVQEPLMELLLEWGAAIDGVPKGSRIIDACLANGRPEAAEFLARCGAQIDFAGAAGLGRLDLVKAFFNQGGRLQANGLAWACLYGRAGVIEFLLEKRADLSEGENVGQTPLHQAVIGGHLDIVKLLLERHAPLEAKNVFGGTVLGQATWSVMNGGRSVDYVSIVELLLDAGASVDAVLYPTGNPRIDELLESRGASIGSRAEGR